MQPEFVAFFGEISNFFHPLVLVTGLASAKIYDDLTIIWANMPKNSSLSSLHANDAMSMSENIGYATIISDTVHVREEGNKKQGQYSQRTIFTFKACKKWFESYL